MVAIAQSDTRRSHGLRTIENLKAAAHSSSVKYARVAVPIWAFHGNADPTVPFEFTKEIFDELSTINGNMKFTELDGVRHNAVDFGFAYEGDDLDKGWITHNASNRTDKTDDIWDWLFKQKR